MSSKKQGASPINYVESDTPSTEKIEAFLLDSSIFSKDTPAARSSYDASRFGELKGNKLVYSFVEALYLVEKEKMLVYSGKKLLEPYFFRWQAILEFYRCGRLQLSCCWRKPG